MEEKRWDRDRGRIKTFYRVRERVTRQYPGRREPSTKTAWQSFSSERSAEELARAKGTVVKGFIMPLEGTVTKSENKTRSLHSFSDGRYLRTGNVANVLRVVRGKSIRRVAGLNGQLSSSLVSVYNSSDHWCRMRIFHNVNH